MYIHIYIYVFIHIEKQGEFVVQADRWPEALALIDNMHHRLVCLRLIEAIGA